MKMLDMINLTEYLIKYRPKDRWGYSSRSASQGRGLLIDKKMPVPDHEKSRTRKVAFAVAKTVSMWRNKFTGETVTYRFGTNRDDWEIVEIESWEPYWIPISNVIRPYDEYLEEKEIEAEIRRQREEQYRKQQEEAIAQHQERADRLKNWLDKIYPEHGIEVTASSYGVSLYQGVTRDINWWEKFMEHVENG